MRRLHRPRLCSLEKCCKVTGGPLRETRFVGNEQFPRRKNRPKEEQRQIYFSGYLRNKCPKPMRNLRIGSSID